MQTKKKLNVYIEYVECISWFIMLISDNFIFQYFFNVPNLHFFLFCISLLLYCLPTPLTLGGREGSSLVPFLYPFAMI